MICIAIRVKALTTTPKSIPGEEYQLKIFQMKSQKMDWCH